jgi:hypothetical protein
MTEYKGPYKSLDEHMARLNSDTLQERLGMVVLETIADGISSNPAKLGTGDPQGYTLLNADRSMFIKANSGLDYDELKERFGEVTDTDGNKIFPDEAEVHKMIDDIFRVEDEEQIEHLENFDPKNIN